MPHTELSSIALCKKVCKKAAVGVVPGCKIEKRSWPHLVLELAVIQVARFHNRGQYANYHTGQNKQQQHYKSYTLNTLL